MTEVFAPSWVRILDLIVGLVTITVGIWLMFNPVYTEPLVVLVLMLGLLLIGFARIIKSYSLKHLSKITRVTKASAGIIAILVGLLVYFLQDLAYLYIMGLVGFAIMILGLARAVVGFKEESLSIKTRAAYILIGTVAFFLGFAALVFGEMGEYVLTIVVSGGLIALGILRVSNIVGDVG